MKEKNTVFDNILFGLELAICLLIPFIVLWFYTTTNILNSNFLFKLLEILGIGGSGIILHVGIPVGIIGIIKSKRMIKLRKTTFVLSIINLAAGSIEILVLFALFCVVVF